MTEIFYEWKSYRLLALSLLFFIIHLTAEAKVICNNTEAPEIRGQIESGDFPALLSCLKIFVDHGMPEPIQQGQYKLRKIGWVWFNSEGGDVNESIKIGRFMRESLADVAVNEQCSSACFLAIVGAIEVSAPFAQIGIHRVFYDSESLGKTNIKDYESHYNEIKKDIRAYCYDMDVPTSIVEKMFSTSSREIHILTQGEVSQLSKHPAYDEWINAKCPNSLVGKEKADYQAYVSAGFKNIGYADGYIEYLKRTNSKYEQCKDAVRWEQFKKTVFKYSKKY